MAVSNEELRERFGWHPPVNWIVRDTHDQVRVSCAVLAETLNNILPESREKSLALTAVQEASQWSNAAIAIHLNKQQAEIGDDD